MRADLPALNGRVQGPTFSPATLGTQTFVLDPETGCLRQTMPGEKSTHRFDPRRGFVRKKPRRMNPLNVKAARRAARRVDATLDAVKSLVSISEASKKGVRAGGKVVKFRTRPKRRRKVC